MADMIKFCLAYYTNQSNYNGGLSGQQVDLLIGILLGVVGLFAVIHAIAAASTFGEMKKRLAKLEEEVTDIQRAVAAIWARITREK